MKISKNIFVVALAFVIIALAWLSFTSPNIQAAGSYSEGSLLALEGVEDSAVYYIGADGMKYIFPDGKTYYTWYEDFNDVVKVSVAELDLYPDGGAMTYRAGTKLITHENTAKIYAVEPSGMIRWISTAVIAEALYGSDWSDRVQDVIPGYFSSSYTKSTDLAELYPDGSLVKIAEATYYINDGTKRLFTGDGFAVNNFKDRDVIEADNLDAYSDDLNINSKESNLASFITTASDDTQDDADNTDDTGNVDDDVVIVVRDQKIILLGRTIGLGLYQEGNVEQWFTDYNTNNGTEYTTTFRNYPANPYSNNNFPYDYWFIWKEGNCDLDKLGRECLSKLASDYDVISFKHGYQVSDVLANLGISGVGYNRKSIEAYQANYRELLTTLDQYPDTIFIVWTLPPRHNLYRLSATTSDNLRAAIATRATEFSNWLRDEWLSEDGQAHPNIFVFDFRSNVIDTDNYLKYDYRRIHTYPDPHLNNVGNQEMGILFSQLVVDSIESFLSN